ncbi:MAG: right-handed parallel beta-helix repeat-containing protein [Phycisphaerales bacterium]
MRIDRLRAIACLGAIAFAPAALAGDLNPPGAPGPTMKALDVVEARTPIFAADLPLTINQPGSYYLAENIAAAGGGITVAASEVSIDLNGFALIGGTGTAIQDSGVQTNISVRNGSVRGWSGGIVLDSADGVLVESVRTSDNSAQGIWIGSGVIRGCVSTRDVAGGSSSSYALAVNEGVVESCAVIESAGNGIWLGAHGAARGCMVRSVAFNGFLLGVGSTLSDSTVRTAGGDGVLGSTGVTVTNVSVYDATGNGIQVSVGSTVTNCTLRLCDENGVNALGSATITNNTASGCGDGIAAGAGFRTSGAGNRLDSNNATDCNRGFYITAQGDFMIRNTARNCTVGYQQTGTNVYGTIISNNYSPITTTNPWVNFEIF